MMEYKYSKKKAPGRGEVTILGETYAPGKPESNDLGKWRQKLGTREDRLRYLQSAEWYWTGEK